MAITCNYGRGMKKVVIIVNAEVNEQGKLISASPVTQKMVEALNQSIASCSSPSTVIEIASAGNLWSKYSKLELQSSSIIYCPLTIQLPEYFDFPAKKIYSACKDLVGRRRWVRYEDVFSKSTTEIGGVDTLVYATPRRADDSLVSELADTEIHLIGDCMAPRNLMVAIHEGHAIGNLL